MIFRPRLRLLVRVDEAVPPQMANRSNVPNPLLRSRSPISRDSSSSHLCSALGRLRAIPRLITGPRLGSVFVQESTRDSGSILIFPTCLAPRFPRNPRHNVAARCGSFFVQFTRP